MLNIISKRDYFFENNILELKEEIENEGFTIIEVIQSILVEELDSFLGYEYNPIDKTIKLKVDCINSFKKSIQKAKIIYENIEDSIEKNELNQNHLIIVFKNLNISFINSIRRVIMDEIQALAFDSFDVIENTTFTPDEILKEKISLIPILINIETFKDDDFVFRINKEYSKNSEYITSNDIINNNEIKTLYDDIIIGKLENNQFLHIKFTCRKGIANKHVKWCSVINIPYNIIYNYYVKNVEILQFFISYNVKIIERNNGFYLQTNNEKIKNIIDNIIKLKNIEKKIISSKEIRIEIKSLGQYSSLNIFKKAIYILKLKYENLQKQLDNFII